MTEDVSETVPPTATPKARPLSSDVARYLIAVAGRAPSVHNTQPWHFRVTEHVIEVYADLGRKLRVDPAGREMLMSCGAALFGLRLGIRSLGYLPEVELLPDSGHLRLLATARLGAAALPTAAEHDMLLAMPLRHTHRGPFAPVPLPAGVVPALQHDALAEGAVIERIDGSPHYQYLVSVLSAVSRRQDRDPQARADILQWTRGPETRARDGVPAFAFPAIPARHPGRLPQRDFDLGRGIGELPADGAPPAETVVLLTDHDGRADWLRAGQALHRLLLHAATRWVFASIHTQPLEAAAMRALIRDHLGLRGYPQVLLQLGVAHTARATARRAPDRLAD